MTVAAFRGEIVTLAGDPRRDPQALVHHRDGVLVVEDGIVAACGDHARLAPTLAGLPVHRLRGIVAPGFVDAHVHYPQTDVIAAHGSQLLDWLDRHVYPAEAAFAGRAHADAVACFFLDELLRNGTTCALVFATVHVASVEALFEAALVRGMRIVSGKVLMDTGAPQVLRDTVARGRADSEALIRTWRGRGRLGYAVTPRFALTSSDAQLASAGDLLVAHPEVLLHTHMAENHAEIAAVAARFPTARDYLDVYARFGLVGARSVFAHCVHIDDGTAARLASAHAGIAFCPTSNLFLGSGLFDLAQAAAHGIEVGVGTDIGAGTSFSVLHSLGAAYQVGQLRGAALDPLAALYLATLGGARAIGLGDRVGALLPGYEADFVVLDPAATPLLARRLGGITGLAERLFALQILGDDRAIAYSFVAGHCRHARDGDAVRFDDNEENRS